ncbi:MAG TPA: hypothetical protein VN958_15685, partial [Chitinophagaceae bacterium]|nr:hypothetical protein [Chitinophagaceae bacterium]
MMLCPLMALVMLTITATCNAQNIFWLQGSWQGKAYLPGSAASQYYNLILRIYNIKDNKFEGIITTMQPSDTSIRFDSKISGIVYDKYLIIHRNKILYIKNPPGIGWKVSCNNCKPPPMIFSIENGKFFFKGEAKDCYKECNGMSEFSKDITEFDSSGKKSLYALVNGVQKPEADTISVAQNSNPSLQDTVASLSKENNLITERIPVLPAGNITLTERNTASRLSQKPPGSLYKTSLLIIQENEPITQRTPVLAAGNITLAEHNTTLLLSQKPPGSLYKTSSLIIQENEPITQRIPVLPAGNITLAEHNIALLLPQKSPRS